MTEVGQVYVCDECGNMVVVFRKGGGTLVCCGKPMVNKVENTVDAAKEKHVPVIEKVDGAIKVSVGSVAHPMTEEHFIEWVSLHGDNYCQVTHLKPGEEPVACSPTPVVS